MTFASAIFLFAFLPIYLACYFLTPYRYKSFVIAGFSYAFYGWWRLDFLGLLLLVTFGNYWIGNRIHNGTTSFHKKAWLAVGVAIDLAVLGYFKYWGFFITSLGALFNDGHPFPGIFADVILPIGISFYIFQAISYIADIYKGDAPPARRLIDFAAFKAMFPQLVAGPVIRYRDIERQFTHREHSWELFSYGATRFFAGLAKKTLIADLVAPIADACFAQPNPTMADAWLGAIAYSIQLYFDFSAYSSMASGLALMMGFRFIENFRFPYLSRSITEFWRRWHISLSTWLREYLYISLGGNRHGNLRTYINLLITMVLGGFWHGANWTFLAWGFWHGALLAGERVGGVTAKTQRNILQWGLTLVLVLIGWVLFRATDIGAAFSMFRGMAGINGVGLSDQLAWQLSYFSLAALIAGSLIALNEPRLSNWFGTETVSEPLVKPMLGPVPLRGAVVVSVLGLLAVAKMLADTESPFLYFQF